MAAKDCIDAIKRALGPDATDEHALDLAEAIDKRAAQLRREDPLLSEDVALRQAARELKDKAALGALIEKRSRAINVLRKQQRFARFDAEPGKEAKVLQEIMVGSQRGVFGAGRSVDAETAALTDGLLGPMLGELRQAGLLPLLTKAGPDFERDVARELFRLTNKAGPESGNKLAAETAKILAKYQEKARLMQNAEGAFIGKLDGYITKQSHDPWRMQRAGFQAWRDEILPRLDPRTFDDVADPEGFLKGIYDGLVSGLHLRVDRADWLGGFKGPGNLAKRVSQERVLHFKDADAWFGYNQRFGTSSLIESVAGTLRHAAQTTALMRQFGTNPEAAFLADLQQLAARARDRGAFELSQQLQRAGNGNGMLAHQFAVISGRTNSAANLTVAHWSAATRAWLTMAKLGGVVLSSLPDIAVKASALRHHGIPYLQTVADGFQAILRGRGSAEQRAIADLIGVGIDGTIGSVFARFSGHDNLPGRMSKLMQTFMKLNLLSWWTDSQATGAGLMVARHLANHLDREWPGVPADLQRSLGRYGISAEDWAVIRQIPARTADGEKFLTPDRVAELTDDQVRPLAKPNKKGEVTDRAIRQARTELEIKLRSYITDTVREAMTEAGGFERAITTLGTQKGTVLGEALRFVMQFKTYGVTFASRHVGRELRRKGSIDFAGLAGLIVATTAMGYVSMQAKELTKGRTPRLGHDPESWGRIFAAAMVQGGGFGIYGDFLFGEYNRFGGSPIETLSGPGIGEGSNAIRALGHLLRGELKEAADLGVDLGKSNLPFVNLFYTRQALDWLILYDLSEAMSPGYLRRTERRIREENGQRFLLSPSQHRIRPFTG